MATFLVMARPALRKCLGARDVLLPVVQGELSEDLVNRGGRRHFVRVSLEGGKVRAAGMQASHAMSSLALSNGLVDVPPKTTLEKGASVSVMKWR